MLPNPSGVWNVFRKHVERRPRIRQRYETRAVDLVQDPDSLEVLGVLVTHAGKKAAIRARRAVVMCTGGFENDLQMQRDYFGLEYVRTFGTPGNTGDGVRMLQKAGAEMWHLRGRNQAGGFWPGFESPDGKLFMARNVRLTAGSWIDIGRDNKRIFDESFEYRLNHYRQKVHGHWVDTPHAFALPVHMIFDEAQRQRECLAAHTMGWSAIVDQYVWSEDNCAEVKSGWIVRAGSIRELAVLMKRDPDAVEAEVARYNGFCATGRDLDYGRRPESMQPIATPPYYALAVTPGIVCSTGGGRRDVKSRVISQQGSPIPRLYEVGELGSTFSNLYQTGCFLTECMVFGRIAGREAVRLEPQSG
jgi:succinate dehydrogenase/fumarate reductase flavoprotein subunit